MVAKNSHSRQLKLNPNRRVKVDFTDDCLTQHGGLVFLKDTADEVDLLERLKEFKPIKQRQRGASDLDNLWSLIALLASGRGRLQDLDDLKANAAERLMLGLSEVSTSRRMSDWLSGVTPAHVESLRDLTNDLAKQLVQPVIAEEKARLGYVPIFVDGSDIEVRGHQEGAVKTYGDFRKYWLHAAFVGPMQVSSRLGSGKLRAAGDWRQQFEQDINPLIPVKRDAWVLMDNAYYDRQIAAYLDKQHYHWSISVTNPNNKQPIVALAEDEEEEPRPWTPLSDDESTSIESEEEACWVQYQPKKWHRPIDYVVIRRWLKDEAEDEMLSESGYAYTLIAVSTAKHGLKETVRRHRSKQGCENHFKGPLIEMDLHHPPTSKLKGNQLYYERSSDLVVVIAQLLLITLRRRSPPDNVQHHGLRPIIRDFIRSVVKLTSSGGYFHLKFCKLKASLEWLMYAANVYDTS